MHTQLREARWYAADLLQLHLRVDDSRNVWVVMCVGCVPLPCQARQWRTFALGHRCAWASRNRSP
eukprot:3106866-Alexandrium_andersonii.AAC.1